MIQYILSTENGSALFLPSPLTIPPSTPPPSCSAPPSASTQHTSTTTLTLPHAQTSSTLTHTSLIKTPHGDSVFLLHAPASPPQSVPTTLSASKWSLFYASLPPASDSSYLFPARHPFTPTAQACDYLVPERVIVVNLLTWQVGHLIVDVLEPLFHLLSPEAGGDSKNNRIFLNVANSDESGILHELILRDVYEKDTPFGLLKLFTHHPIHPAASLYEIGER